MQSSKSMDGNLEVVLCLILRDQPVLCFLTECSSVQQIKQLHIVLARAPLTDCLHEGLRSQQGEHDVTVIFLLVNSLVMKNTRDAELSGCFKGVRGGPERSLPPARGAGPPPAGRGAEPHGTGPGGAAASGRAVPRSALRRIT